MPDVSEKRRRRLNRLGAVILVGGLALSAWLLQHADSGPQGGPDYRVVDGKVLPASPGNPAIPKADLERLDGQASILAAEFGRWFGELWQGESLALIVAALSVAGGLACLWAAQSKSERK